MTLIVEDGSGVSGAESYAAVAVIDAYWTNRPQLAGSAVWAGAGATFKEGAAREATAFLDALYGPFYRGQRAGYVQGLMFPRTNALDDAGYPLPALPNILVDACCELSARAISGPLAVDSDIDGVIKRKRETIGPITEETEYADGAGRFSRYGALDGMLASVLNGQQPGSASGSGWNWR